MKDVNRVLIDLIKEHPEARIVTDVGASLFSGWGYLKEVTYDDKQDAIELEFE